MGISRLELWRSLGVEISIAGSMLMSAYEREGDREWRDPARRKTTSFFISSFPGDDSNACGRFALYKMMGIPEEKPIDATGKRWMDAGKDLEMEFIKRYAAEGMLLSGDELAGEQQTRLEDPESWASGAIDAIILPYGWRRGFVVEVKNTSAGKMAAMRADREDTPFSHSKYVRQLKTYIGLAYEQNFAPEVTVCEQSWAIMRDAPMGLHWCPAHQGFDCVEKEIQLEPPVDGELIYASRDPERGQELDTFSYYFERDPEFLAAGKAKLKEWRDHFLRGEIPPHPREGQGKMWSVTPCSWCGFKRSSCKPDYTKKVTALDASHGIDFAQEVRGAYSYDEHRDAVFERWKVDDPLKKKVEAAA